MTVLALIPSTRRTSNLIRSSSSRINIIHNQNKNKNALLPQQMSLPLNSIYRLSVADNTGTERSLASYAGKVALVVNTACLWGKTHLSFTQLEELQLKYLDQGFVVLAFPTNDFHQELDTNRDIQIFLRDHFEPGMTFPVFGISSLRTNPVYRTLQEQLPHEVVQHNFYKYLVDRQGVARHLYPKSQAPVELEADIEQLLLASSSSSSSSSTGGETTPKRPQQWWKFLGDENDGSVSNSCPVQWKDSMSRSIIFLDFSPYFPFTSGRCKFSMAIFGPVVGFWTARSHTMMAKGKTRLQIHPIDLMGFVLAGLFCTLLGQALAWPSSLGFQFFIHTFDNGAESVAF
jgi:glutathione peroxidase